MVIENDSLFQMEIYIDNIMEQVESELNLEK